MLQHLNDLVLDIQHVGSTAVPGLEAKPSLDIAVAVTSLVVIPQCRNRLLAIGYIDRGDARTNGGYLFVKESTPQVRTHHLHIVTADDPQWRNYLQFRDLLRVDEELRSRYATRKNSLQEQFAHDRRAYSAAKEEFIRGMLVKINTEGNGKSLY